MLTSCERYGDYRIPHLRVAKTSPQMQPLSADEVQNHPLWKFFVGDAKLPKPKSFYFEGRARGVKNK